MTNSIDLNAVKDQLTAVTCGYEVAQLTEGQPAFVPAGADHRFTGYENLTVLVIFARPHEAPAS